MSKNLLGLSLLLGAALLGPAVAGEPSSSKTNAFFAFCIDTHDAKKRNLEQQAALLILILCNKFFGISKYLCNKSFLGVDKLFNFWFQFIELLCIAFGCRT